MMKCKQLIKPLCFAAVLLVASTCYGQTVAVLTGSSGAFNSMAVAAAIKDPLTGAPGVCASTDGLGVAAPGGGFYHLWTSASSAHTAFGVDARVGPPQEFGNLWVLWDSDANPQTVCAYLSVDSIVGMRLYFGTSAAGAHATLGLAAMAFVAGNGTTCPAAVNFSTTAGVGGQAPFLTDDPCGLPQGVYNLLFPTLPVPPVQFTVGISDIRPEDAEFANNRALSPCAGGNCLTDKAKNGLGYGPAPFGAAIDSAYSATSAQVVQFGISGTDPVTGGPITPSQTRRIGAYPMMIFYSLTPTVGGCAGDFVNIKPTNVPSHTLALIEQGGLTRTTDLIGTNPATNPAGCAMSVVHREATSGTFNTFEFQVPRVIDFGGSQEVGVNPANAGCFAPPGAAPVECGNPYYHIAADGSTRSHVVGSGEMVKVVDGAEHISGGALSAPNGLGYAFWTFSSFAAAAAQANLRYLQLDGVDPILPAYTTGQFPACAGLPCKIPLTNVKNGAYRNWNIITIAEPVESGAVPPAEALADAIVAAGQDQADPVNGNITDFVPFQDLSGPGNTVAHIFQVFRSHYAFSGLGVARSPLGVIVPNLSGGILGNGTNPTPVGPLPAYFDNGGDMAGGIFYDQNDVNFLTDNSAEIWGFLQ
ncbi:MAG: hypothetical protein WB780_00660 [Candidatus Acidiferrales bacterium]